MKEIMLRLHKLLFLVLVSCFTYLPGMEENLMGRLRREVEQTSRLPGASMRQTGAIEFVVRDALNGGLIKPSLIALSIFVVLTGQEQLLDLNSIWTIAIGLGWIPLFEKFLKHMSYRELHDLLDHEVHDGMMLYYPIASILPTMMFLLKTEDPCLTAEHIVQSGFGVACLMFPCILGYLGKIFRVANNHPIENAVVWRDSCRVLYGFATLLATFNSVYMLESCRNDI